MHHHHTWGTIMFGAALVMLGCGMLGGLAAYWAARRPAPRGRHHAPRRRPAGPPPAVEAPPVDAPDAAQCQVILTGRKPRPYVSR